MVAVVESICYPRRLLVYIWSGGLTFAERIAQNTPALLDLQADYDWTDEDTDDGEMEPITHNKVEVCPEVTGSSSCPNVGKLLPIASSACLTLPLLTPDLQSIYY